MIRTWFLNRVKWVLVSSTDKMSNNQISKLRFELHKKLVSILVWWERTIIENRHWLKFYLIYYYKKKKKKKKGKVGALMSLMPSRGILGVQAQWTFGEIPEPILGAEGVHLNLLRIFLILKQNRVSTHTSFLSFGRWLIIIYYIHPSTAYAIILWIFTLHQI